LTLHPTFQTEFARWAINHLKITGERQAYQLGSKIPSDRQGKPYQGKFQLEAKVTDKHSGKLDAVTLPLMVSR